MKTKFLITLIIISSLISGMIGAIIFIKYFENNLLETNETESINSQKIENLDNLEKNITNLVKNISPSVVSIIIKKDLALYKSDPWGFFREYVGSVNQKIGGGTGFFITKDGLIITNKHVIIDKDAEYTVITNDKKEFSAKVIAIDPLIDLAILKIKGDDFIPLNFIKNENNIQIGQFAISVGNALAKFQNSVSLGVISGKNRNIKDENINLSNLIQTDTAINPGNSGGPLVNLKGEVMGINTAIISGSQGIGFSIGLSKKKINYILKSIEKYSEIKKPSLLINYVILSDSLSKSLGLNVNYGAYIDKENGIVLGSALQKVGVEGGDIILEVDNIKITLNYDLNQVLQDKVPGDKLNLKVMKGDGVIKNIEVTLGEV